MPAAFCAGTYTVAYKGEPAPRTFSTAATSAPVEESICPALAASAVTRPA
ncbi:hypothetical protein SALBM217S_03185 [Streptomyces griseoloalbus]